MNPNDRLPSMASLQVPTVGLGTFPFAGPFTAVTEDTALSIIDAFVAHGGKYIDTAPTYAFGAVESLLGRAIRSRGRDQFIIASSCGYRRVDGSRFEVSGRPDDIRKECDGSLSRLGVDYLDVLFSHIPDPATPYEETIGAMEELKTVGKIRAIGVSNVTLDQLKRYNKTGAVQYVQQRCSLINRAIDSSFFGYCVEAGIGLTVYQCIERGMLSALGRDWSRLGGHDLRRSKPEFRDHTRALIGAWVLAELEPLARERGLSVPALAVAWMASQPNVRICQCGATSAGQIIEIMQGARHVGSATLLKAVDRAYALLERLSLAQGAPSVRSLLGLDSYNIYSGSASGRKP